MSAPPTKTPGGGQIPQATEISTLILLSREGLEAYYERFSKAGYKMLDAQAHLTDFQAEQIIDNVENNSNIVFPDAERVKLWKALRFQWFRGPGHMQPFVERHQIPRLHLPFYEPVKADDDMDFSRMDPDRQRQVVRKSRTSSKPSAKGRSVSTMQFEAWKRQRDQWYVLKDIDRCIQEWQIRNPRTMVKEDPREEVMMLRIRNLQDWASDELSARRSTSTGKQHVAVFLWFLRMSLVALAWLMCGIAYYRYSNVPSALTLSYVCGSKQFISGMSFFVAYMVAFVVSQRWKDDPMSVKLQRLLYTCQRLYESICDFRVETEADRMSADQMRDLQWNAPKMSVPAGGKSSRQKRGKSRGESADETGEPRKRRKKPKEPKDPAFDMWISKEAQARAKENSTGDPLEHVMNMQRDIFDSYKRLPDQDKGKFLGFKKFGGNRMVNFAGRMGMPMDHEEKLCIRMQKTREAARSVGIDNLPPQVPLDLALPAAAEASLPSPPPAASTRSGRSGGLRSNDSRSPSRPLSQVVIVDAEGDRPPTEGGERPTSRRRPTNEPSAALAGEFDAALAPSPDAASAEVDRQAEERARLAPWLPGYMPPEPEDPSSNV